MALSVDDEKPDGWSNVAEHIQRVEAPTTLSELQLARIARRVFDAPARTRRPRWIAPAIAFGALAILLLIGRALSLRTTAAPTIAPAKQARAAPAPDAEPARLAVLDSGVVVPVSARGTVVREGRVAIRTADGALTVDVPEGQVTVPPHSLVEIDVRNYSTKVAVYRGQATFSTSEWKTIIPPEQAADARGIMVKADNRASLLDRALDLPAQPPTRPATTPAQRSRGPAQVRPPGAVAEVPSVSVVVAPPEAGLSQESELVGAALRKLNEHDAAAALQFADDHAMRFPLGALTGEMSLVRAEALAQLGRRRESAAALDRAMSQGAGPVDRIAVLRGELRAASGDCTAALTDFDAAVRSSDGEVASRARFDRGACRARVGDRDGARDDLRLYLRVHPNGANAAAARRALGD
jgi:hypothetical protein